MLKFLAIVGITVAVLFVVACIGVACLMAFIILTTPKDGDVLSDRRASDVAPSRSAMLFSQLAREAMAYATRPYVTTIIEVNGVFWLSTVGDPFGRRVYAESRRRVGKTLVDVICVYEDGGHVPTAMASIEIPASQVDWPAHFNSISDVAANGPLMSYVDHVGIRREVRIPKTRRYHA
ncbi:MAG TPA: hypothetical protein VL283_03700 [Candidatus Baltobacteraceae bacterium]|nr:hypothetical protein [Candidatus Baltobacteraceae bacterium]